MRSELNNASDERLIIKLVADKKVGLRSWVRWRFDDFTYLVTSSSGWLYEQLIITNQRNHFAITIDGIFAKHFSERH